jgi:hypothetical protein
MVLCGTVPSFRARLADTILPDDIVVTESMVDDFFISGHQQLVRIFTVRPADDRPLESLRTNLASQSRSTKSIFADVGERTAAMNAEIIERRDKLKETEELVNSVAEKAHEIDVGRAQLRETITEMEIGFLQVSSRIGMIGFASVISLFWIIMRLFRSPFVSAEDLLPALSVHQAQHTLMATLDLVREKARREPTRGLIDRETFRAMSDYFFRFEFIHKACVLNCLRACLNRRIGSIPNLRRVIVRTPVFLSPLKQKTRNALLGKGDRLKSNSQPLEFWQTYQSMPFCRLPLRMIASVLETGLGGHIAIWLFH